MADEPFKIVAPVWVIVLVIAVIFAAGIAIAVLLTKPDPKPVAIEVKPNTTMVIPATKLTKTLDDLPPHPTGSKRIIISAPPRGTGEDYMATDSITIRYIIDVPREGPAIVSYIGADTTSGPIQVNYIEYVDPLLELTPNAVIGAALRFENGWTPVVGYPVLRFWEVRMSPMLHMGGLGLMLGGEIERLNIYAAYALVGAGSTESRAAIGIGYRL